MSAIRSVAPARSNHLLRPLSLILLVTAAAFAPRTAWVATGGGEAAAWGTQQSNASLARGWETPGERLDLRDGTYGFEITDLVIPGTAGLDVEVVRSYDKQRLLVGDDRAFGIWDIEIPRIVTLGLPGTGNVGTGSCGYARNPLQDYVVVTNWWAGATLIVPHEDPKPLLIYHKQGPLPAAADFVTTDNWYATCSGANWIVHAPSGRTYRMDRASIGTNGAVVYASRVSDPHGNWIAYDYTTYLDGSPQRQQQLLTAIRGSAGQTVTVASQRLVPGAPAIGPDQDYVISEISHAGRTWKYAYTFCADVGSGTPVEPCDQEPLLLTVTRPDGKTWQYRYHKRISYAVGPGGCCQRNFFFIYKATHPNGLVAQYTVTEQPQQFFDAEPYNEKMWSLAQKTLSGPALPTYTWNFWFEVPGYQGGLNGTAWGTPIIQTYVQGPDRVHYFETERGQAMAGAAFGERSTNPANWVKGLPRTSAVLPYPAGIASPSRAQVEQHVYDQWLACVFNRTSACRSEFTVQTFDALPSLGSIANQIDGESTDPQLRRPRVLTKRVVYRDTGTYTTELTSYSALGYPGHLREYSGAGPQRDVDLTWFHDESHWITGLLAERTVVGEGTVYTSYDSKGLPFESGRFGLFENYAWWPDGTLRNVSRYDDGRIVFTREFADYKLGIAQTETRPEGVSLTRTVNDTGTIAAERNARGYTTKHAFDALNRLKSTTPPRGKAVTFSWTGNRILTTTRGSRKRITTHDALGRLIKVEDADTARGTSIIRTWKYDSAGRIIFQSNPGAGAATSAGIRYEYDALDRPIRATRTVDQGTRTWEYLDGNKIVETDPRGFRTTSTFRAFGDPAATEVMRTEREVKLDDPSRNIVTVLNRNLLGQVISVARGGYKKTIQYDANKLPWRITEPETGTTELTYDRAGNLVTRRVGSSAVTSYAYDDLDRLEFIDYPGTTPDISRVYDANGNVRALYSGLTTESMTYDANDNLLSFDLEVSGQTISTRYAYDALDSLSSMTYPDGEVVAYAPDAFGRPTRVGNYVTEATYHASGPEDHVSFGNGLVAWQTLDSLLRPSRVHGGSAYDVAYQYDASGNVTGVADAFNADHDHTLVYDGADRIDYAWYPATSPYYTWGGDFDYDKVGNLKKKSTPRGTFTYAYDSSTRRLSSVSGSRNYAFTYDAYGNVTRNGSGTGSGTFMYDDAGRLRSFVIQGVKSGSYEYDGNMRRARTIDNGRTTYSLYLGDALVFEYSPTIGVLWQHYFLGDRIVATREKSGFATGTFGGGSSKITYLHTDPRGSVIAATNASGATLWREAYDPFGGRIVKPAAHGNTLWYTGREFDNSSGLAYHGARYYDPQIGRFMSPDPVSWTGGNLELFNRYAYAGNNPLGRTDIDGEIPALVVYFLVVGGKAAIENIIFQHAMMGVGLQDSFSWSDLGIDVAVGLATGGMSSVNRIGKTTEALRVARTISRGQTASRARSAGRLWSPATEPGPLSSKVAATFRSGTYIERTLSEPMTLYRVYSDPAKKLGGFWTRTKPKGPLQSVIDSAVDQDWGNAATNVVTIRVPAGTRIFEGAAASQRGLVGGGNQVFLESVSTGWIVQ